MKKKVVIKIGEKRQMELYAAISDPVMNLRVKFLKERRGDVVDTALYNLVDAIWRKQAYVLGIKNP